MAPKRTCKISDCSSPTHCLGFCNAHYLKYKRYGSPNISKHSSPGSGLIHKSGHRVISVSWRRIFEHRYVMEQILGRPLLPFPEEIVHHINENKLDNSPDNLQIMTNAEHKRQHQIGDRYIGRDHAECSKCHIVQTKKRFSKGNNVFGIRAECKSCQNKDNVARLRRKADL
mgnify:CR=1 FL=1